MRAVGGIEQISRSLVLLHHTKSREVLGRHNVARRPTRHHQLWLPVLANMVHITLFRKTSRKGTY